MPDAAASPHPAPNVRDDREAPSCRHGTTRICRDDLPDGESEEFFAKGLDIEPELETGVDTEFARRAAFAGWLTGSGCRSLHLDAGFVDHRREADINAHGSGDGIPVRSPLDNVNI